MENQEMNSNSFQDEEITLKELILKVKEYYFECKKNWKLILLFTVPFVGYQLYLRFTVPPYYPATLTFMVNDSKGSSVGGLLGQFRGLVGEDEDKLDKILELAKTRRTISAALFKKVIINKKEDYFANHLIQIENIHDIWTKDSTLANFSFSRPAIDSFTLQENRALRQVHQTLIGGNSTKPLFTTVSMKKTGIMTFMLQTQNEDFTIAFIKALYNSLSDFYIESTVRKEKETYDILCEKRDSLEKVLFINDMSTAKHEDQNNSLLLQTDKVPVKRYARNNQILTALYGEIIKNTEFAEFALKTATPFITSIDEPIPPLKPIKEGRLKNLIIYLLIGFALGCVFVIVRKLIHDSM